MSTDTLAQGSASGGQQAGLAAHLPDDLKVTQWRVVRSEWLKFWSLRSSYITLGATVVGMIAFGVLFSAVTANRWPVLRGRPGCGSTRPTRACVVSSWPS